MSEAPAEVWVSANEHDNGCEATWGPSPAAVRYVRADLYEAALARLSVVRSWGEAPCLEPLPPDAGAHEQRPGEAMADALRALREAP